MANYALPNLRTTGAINNVEAISFFNPERGLRQVPGALADLLGAVRADVAAILALSWMDENQRWIEVQELKRRAYDASKDLQGNVTQASIQLRGKTSPGDAPTANDMASEVHAQRVWARAKDVLDATEGDIWEAVQTATTVQDVITLRQEIPAWLKARPKDHKLDGYRKGEALTQMFDAYERTLMSPAELAAANQIDGVALGCIQTQNALDIAVAEFAGKQEFGGSGWTVLPGFGRGESITVPAYQVQK